MYTLLPQNPYGCKVTQLPWPLVWFYIGTNWEVPQMGVIYYPCPLSCYLDFSQVLGRYSDPELHHHMVCSKIWNLSSLLSSFPPLGCSLVLLTASLCKECVTVESRTTAQVGHRTQDSWCLRQERTTQLFNWLLCSFWVGVFWGIHLKWLLSPT